VIFAILLCSDSGVWIFITLTKMPIPIALTTYTEEISYRQIILFTPMVMKIHGNGPLLEMLLMKVSRFSVIMQLVMIAHTVFNLDNLLVWLKKSLISKIKSEDMLNSGLQSIGKRLDNKNIKSRLKLKCDILYK
jgi:hypothetical protein